MAAGAGPLAILIGWAITAIGMLALVFVYQSLATRKPELDAGPYADARPAATSDGRPNCPNLSPCFARVDRNRAPTITRAA